MVSDLKNVKTYQTRSEAEVAKSLLDANNISAIVSADDEGGMAPFPLQVSPTGVKLMVSEKDFEKAAQLLK